MKGVSFFLVVLLFPAVSYGWFSTTIDTVEVRYPSGQLREQYQTYFFEGTGSKGKYGFYRSWYENGQMQWKGNYAQDLKIGCWLNWDSSGFLLTETSYNRGLKNGTDIDWNLDGTYRKLLYYKNDSLHGLCTWNKAGIIMGGIFNTPDLVIDSQSFYLDGKLIVNLWNLYDSSSYFSMSGRPRYQNYNRELDLWYECKGLEPAISMSNKNATIFIGHKEDGKKHGLWIAWDKSGNMKKIELYNNGTMVTLE